MAAIRCVTATVAHELRSFNMENIIAFVTLSHGDNILNEVFHRIYGSDNFS